MTYQNWFIVTSSMSDFFSRTDSGLKYAKLHSILHLKLSSELEQQSFALICQESLYYKPWIKYKMISDQNKKNKKNIDR